MPDGQPILFFSDAHFGAHGPSQEADKRIRFLSLLAYARSIGAEVFFLGDLFDFWFEYRHWIPRYGLEILAAIGDFTRSGGTFHLVIGNHDGWAEDYFQKELGIEVHRGDETFVRQGLRLYLSHGDGKAPSDRGYRILRRVIRARWAIRLYRLWPADWAYRTARFFSGQSRELTGRRPPKFLEEYDRVAADLLESGFDAVLMGHLHQGWVRKIGNGWWINTGEFFDAFHCVELSQGEFRLGQCGPDGPKFNG